MEDQIHIKLEDQKEKDKTEQTHEEEKGVTETQVDFAQETVRRREKRNPKLVR